MAIVLVMILGLLLYGLAICLSKSFVVVIATVLGTIFTILVPALEIAARAEYQDVLLGRSKYTHTIEKVYDIEGNLLREEITVIRK